MLYKAMYCGVCKGISASCGQCARMGLTYDVTFLSVILHNIAGVDVTIEKQHCLTQVLRSKPMACVDDMTKKLGALNTALVYYKYTDDIKDGDINASSGIIPKSSALSEITLRSRKRRKSQRRTVSTARRTLPRT